MISIIIPCHNEVHTIKKILKKIIYKDAFNALFCIVRYNLS